MKVLLFGISKDIVGERFLDVPFEDLSDVNSLLTRLENSYPKFQDLKSVAVAVNEDYVSHDYELKESDEVAIIPPVSGG